MLAILRTLRGKAMPPLLCMQPGIWQNMSHSSDILWMELLLLSQAGQRRRRGGKVLDGTWPIKESTGAVQLISDLAQWRPAEHLVFGGRWLRALPGCRPTGGSGAVR